MPHNSAEMAPSSLKREEKKKKKEPQKTHTRKISLQNGGDTAVNGVENSNRNEKWVVSENTDVVCWYSNAAVRY